MSNSSQNNPPPPPPPPPSTSSSSSSSSSTTPPSIVQTGHGAGSGGSGGESSSKKKRVRRDVGGASSSAGGNGGEENKRKKGELIDVPQAEPICSICGKKFGSWKGVFGHLRAHPEREWRGAFPPPKGEADWSPMRIDSGDQQVLQNQLLAPTLLDLARQTLEKMREDIDLNREPRQPEDPPPPPPEGGSGSGGGGGFDLNLPPSPEKDTNE